MRDKPKFCRVFLRNYPGKNKSYKIYCGVSKRIESCRKIKEFCKECGAYNKGWERGYNQKIKSIKKCQLLTCNKVASRVICQGSFLINVCPAHSNGHEWRDIKEDDVK